MKTMLRCVLAIKFDNFDQDFPTNGSEILAHILYCYFLNSVIFINNKFSGTLVVNEQQQLSVTDILCNSVLETGIFEQFRSQVVGEWWMVKPTISSTTFQLLRILIEAWRPLAPPLEQFFSSSWKAL